MGPLVVAATHVLRGKEKPSRVGVFLRAGKIKLAAGKSGQIPKMAEENYYWGRYFGAGVQFTGRIVPSSFKPR
jgi:hypothetical protein